MSTALRTVTAAGSISVALFIDYLLSRANVPYRPGVGGALVIAFLATQVGICAAWVAIGGGSSFVQVAASIAVGLGVHRFLLTWNSRALEEFGPGFLAQSATVMLVLVVARLWRFCTIAAMTGDSARHSAVPRFSIRDLLVGTGLIGAALATLVRMQAMRVGRDTAEISTLVGVFLGVITLLSLLSTLTFQLVALPAAVTCTVSLLLGWAVGKAVRYDEVASTIALGAPAVFQVGLFMLVRLAGFRFARMPAVAPEAQDAAAVV